MLCYVMICIAKLCSPALTLNEHAGEAYACLYVLLYVCWLVGFNVGYHHHSIIRQYLSASSCVVMQKILRSHMWPWYAYPHQFPLSKATHCRRYFSHSAFTRSCETSTVGSKCLKCDVLMCEGRLGRSAAHCLSCSLFPVLQRSHANMFVIRTVASLGEITAVRVWHYNIGSHPKWFVLLCLVCLARC